MRFDGDTFSQPRDGERLTKQWERVRDLMLDGQWRTLREIAGTLDVPEASVSARLRDLRKPRFGGYTVEHSNVGGGTWRYRVLTPEPEATPVGSVAALFDLDESRTHSHYEREVA